MTFSCFRKMLPLVLMGLAGCDERPAAVAPVTAPAPEPAKPAMAVRSIRWTDELLHTEIKHYNPAYEGGGQFEMDNGMPVNVVIADQKVDNLRCFEGIPLRGLDISNTNVSDLGPLKGMPLEALMMEHTRVTDLSPLKAARLKQLYISGTAVHDLSALEGMPLIEFNAVGTPVADLAPLAKSPLQMVWLTGCPVANLAALRGLPLVSLTLHRTKVKDLSPLSGTSLQRLHIGETPVEDLSPLKGLGLTRLVFTPGNIKAGLDVARSLPLQEIGTRFDDDGKDLAAPGVFWATQGPPASGK